MKKIVLLAGLALGLCTSFQSEAQVRVNINIGAPVMQQPWYDNDDDYYYMPDQGVYYNVRRRVYVYPQGGNWMYANSLPPSYGNYTHYNSRYHRVRARAPFSRNDYYHRQYAVASNNGYRGNNMRGYDRRDNNNRDWANNGRGGNRDNRQWNNGNNNGGNDRGNYGGDNRGNDRGNNDGSYGGNNGGSNVHYNRR